MVIEHRRRKVFAIGLQAIALLLLAGCQTLAPARRQDPAPASPRRSCTTSLNPPPLPSST